MSDQPSAKRIKLSLEPFLSNNVSDILDTGQEILKTETNLSEKLMTTVDRIWFERGEWKDITEKSLAASIQSKDGDEDDLNDEKESTTADNDASKNQPRQPQIPEMDIFKLREFVINQFLHGKSEVDVALDVVNILAASNRSSSATLKDLVLPSGSLTATYVTKPRPTTKAQLESVQLNLGLKRKKQREAADFLKKSASALRDLVEKEQTFWDEALELRRNNWQMQSGGSSHTGAVYGINPSATAAGSSFYVQYGFSEVGSDFNEASVGELRRSDDALETTASSKKNLQLLLPHGVPRKVIAEVKPSHLGRLGFVQGYNNPDDGILGITKLHENRLPSDENNENENCDLSSRPILSTYTIDPSQSVIQSRLIEAYSTVFDSELFADVLAEAQALSSNVRFPIDEIVISIDGQLDLSIRKVTLNNKQQTDTTDAHKATTAKNNKEIVSHSVGLAFKLLLLQHQRYNVWRTKAKILSNNYKLRQLIKQQDNAAAAAAAAGASSSTNAAAGTTNTTNAAAGAAASQQQNPNALTTGVVGSTAKTTPSMSKANLQSTSATAASAAAGVTGSLVLGTPTLAASGVTNATASASNLNGAATSASVGGNNPSLSNHRAQTTARDTLQPPTSIPILDPILSYLRFWIQFEKMNHVVQTLLAPFQQVGCCGFFTHVTFFSNNGHTASSTSARKYDDVYPGFGRIALGLSINLSKGPSLHFGLDPSGFISVYLPQTTVILQNVSEFEAFLSREIKIIVLRSVCEVANDIILSQHDDTSNSNNSNGHSDKQHYLWRVDQVDESIHGYVCCYDKEKNSIWRNITVRLIMDKNRQHEVIPVLEFQLSSANADHDNVLQEMTCQMPLSADREVVVTLDGNQQQPTHTMPIPKLAMNFKEKVRVLIQRITQYNSNYNNMQ